MFHQRQKTNTQNRHLSHAAAALMSATSILCLAACDSISEIPDDRYVYGVENRGDSDLCNEALNSGRSLSMAEFDDERSEYRFGAGGVAAIVGAPPDDTDFGSWAMLHDGDEQVLYIMSRFHTAVHEFRPDESLACGGRPGFRLADTFDLGAVPDGANRWSFAALHSGRRTHVYLLETDTSSGGASFAPQKIYQGVLERDRGEFVWDDERYYPNMPISNSPDDATWRRWGMMHGDRHNDYYLFSLAGQDFLRKATIVEHKWDRSQQSYNHSPGDDTAASRYSVVGIPYNAATNNFAMFWENGGKPQLVIQVYPIVGTPTPRSS